MHNRAKEDFALAGRLHEERLGVNDGEWEVGMDPPDVFAGVACTPGFVGRVCL